MRSLQIYQWVCQWKNFENRLTFGEVMGKSLVSCFFLRHSVYLDWRRCAHWTCRCGRQVVMPDELTGITKQKLQHTAQTNVQTKIRGVLAAKEDLAKGDRAAERSRLRSRSRSWLRSKSIPVLVRVGSCRHTDSSQFWTQTRNLSHSAFYRAMLSIRGTSHEPVSVCVCLCLSVCHKSVFYRNR